MSHQLDKAYDPKKYESKLYQKWEDSGAFKPEGNAHLRGLVGDEMQGDAEQRNKAYTDVLRMSSTGNDEAARSEKDPFTIIMPPPNANGHIHMGTAMFVIEDLMIRYRRMQGHKTLWLPGMDHAGIETQVVYERELEKQGKSRFDLGRDEFYRQVDAFTKSNMGIMTSELKSMGFSTDWSRLTYTLDPKVVSTVYDTFKELHDAGYIYRGNRIVNWCPFCRSAFADIEVKYREQVDPLYYIKYGPFVLATVRPETKFGDTAIAVNPKDERYARLIGTTIEAEDLNGPITLQVIGDDHIDPAFGTGAMKVTPAHDPNDWEIGLRHNLRVIQTIGTDGLLTPVAGKYAGMPVAEARTQVAHDLEERGLMDHIEYDYTHSVGYHDRCGTLIEPLTVEQWWLRVDELKKPAIKAFETGEIQIVPARFKKVCMDWLENLRDWNISRQNWWGIRIPVYYNATADKSLPEYIIGTEDDAKATYGIGGYEAETDNFDTWFSSGQWPYATLMATGDFDAQSGRPGFYPTSVMETGRDILFQWVTRMVMLGIFKTGQVPFKTVYLHGLITDEHGKKMSKSKGNVLNPLEMTAKYGTDAVRLALTIGITAGNDGPLSERKIEGYRNFCNKLWNVARFILGQLPDGYSPATPELHSPADHWIASRTAIAITSVTQAIEDYRFSEAGQIVYSLLWDDFADWYIEASKVSPNHDLLVHTLETILALAHPIAPFVTEAIWSEMPWRADQQLITSAWPIVDTRRTSNEQAQRFAALQDVVMKARTVIAEEQLSKPTLITTDKSLAESADLLQRLGRLGKVEYQEQGSGLYLGAAVPAWIAADAELIATRKHRLQGQLKAKQTYAKSLEGKLNNQGFVANAPAAVVADTRDRLAEARQQATRLSEQLKALGE
ncbi:MAG TPA: valine--tRNA ligase [Candidatus Saccharimonadia bacterium]